MFIIYVQLLLRFFDLFKRKYLEKYKNKTHTFYKMNDKEIHDDILENKKSFLLKTNNLTFKKNKAYCYLNQRFAKLLWNADIHRNWNALKRTFQVPDRLNQTLYLIP